MVALYVALGVLLLAGPAPRAQEDAIPAPVRPHLIIRFDSGIPDDTHFSILTTPNGPAGHCVVTVWNPGLGSFDVSILIGDTIEASGTCYEGFGGGVGALSFLASTNADLSGAQVTVVFPLGMAGREAEFFPDCNVWLVRAYID